MLYQQTLSRLNKLLSEENIIKSISIYEQRLQNFVKNNTDKTAWYSVSYPMILKRYQETRGSSNLGAWIERVALLSSWLPSIPNPDLNKKAIEEMVFLESIFHDVRLEEVGVESFLGAVNTIYHGEMIFDTEDRPPVLLKTFLENADKITNLSGRWEDTLSTTTKLLHFMCPHLFPIFDRKVCQVLFGEKQKYARYHCYIFALREFLQTADEFELIYRISLEKDVPAIRVVDYILFNQ